MKTKITDRGKLGTLELKNRVIMAPMGTHMGDGLGERTRSYFERRIKGGPAMIMVNMMVTDYFEDASASALLNQDTFCDFQKLVETAHAEDCCVCVQLMSGCGRMGAPSQACGGLPICASAVPYMYMPQLLCHQLTKEEIQILVEATRRTAEYAVRAGADAIEIHAYGGYLMDQFLTKRWNIRTDEYGGELEGRMRFLYETIDACRQAAGEDFPILVKYTPDHSLPPEDGYRALNEGIDLAKRLEEYGVAALHICASSYDNWTLAMPSVYFQDMTIHMELARQLKGHVSIPVMTGSRLGDVSKAVYALEKEILDYAVIGRGFLAEPDWFAKAAAGRTADIRPCISCNEGCIARVCSMDSISCAVNPECGFETERMLPRTENSKHVLVVGAGPAGCAAALYAAQAGHRVEIWERGARLGGNVLAASQPLFKRDMGNLLRYYEVQLAKEGIPIHYLKEADPKAIEALGPEAVIWAAGGKPIRPKAIAGIHGENVCLAADALRGLCPLGQRLVVIGGGLVGCETAVHFAMEGKQVTLVEMADTLLPEEMFAQNKEKLLSLVASEKIEILTKTRLTEIGESGILLSIGGGEETTQVPCDHIILAMGYSPNLEGLEEMQERCRVIPVGDSIKARRVLNAVWDAYEAAGSL